MKSDRNIKISKFLSLALRNQPEKRGTTEPFPPSISVDGLVKGQRHDERLSESGQVAALVGARRGRRVILRIASVLINRDGHAFFRSLNVVWLMGQVPVKYTEFPGVRQTRRPKIFCPE
jgi:RNA:NAD 2'-phosphotransferase (TPT1/KptA family)